MSPPAADIIVPIWNNPNEARDCLSALLAHSSGARLIIVDNGCDRQTQQVIEEFSDALEERCLLLASARNIGLVRAINMGLSRSDGEFSVIVRPHVRVTEGWLNELLEAAARGLASPVFSGDGAPFPIPCLYGNSRMETDTLSFATLALRSEVHMLLGGFDENLDGGVWCLRDFVSRAGVRGYRTCITGRANVICAPETVLGSDTRRQELARASQASYEERWGAGGHFGVSVGRSVRPDELRAMVGTMLRAARNGYHFTLLLPAAQTITFRALGGRVPPHLNGGDHAAPFPAQARVAPATDPASRPQAIYPGG